GLRAKRTLFEFCVLSARRRVGRLAVTGHSTSQLAKGALATVVSLPELINASRLSGRVLEVTSARGQLKAQTPVPAHAKGPLVPALESRRHARRLAPWPAVARYPPRRSLSTLTLFSTGRVTGSRKRVSTSRKTRCVSQGVLSTGHATGSPKRAFNKPENKTRVARCAIYRPGDRFAEACPHKPENKTRAASCAIYRSRARLAEACPHKSEKNNPTGNDGLTSLVCVPIALTLAVCVCGHLENECLLADSVKP
ncbi:MAG: hypothetical protein BJ554DRAFT_8106, partial [Olpidium bornovanus]